MSDQLTVLRQQLSAVRDEVLEFFNRAESAFAVARFHRPNEIWHALSPEQQAEGNDLGHRIRQIAAQMSTIAKASALVSEADLRDLSRHAKAIAASTHFRRYRYQGVYVHHDEGTVLGVDPPSQHEDDVTRVSEARAIFVDSYQGILDVLDLVSLPTSDFTDAVLRDRGPVVSYRKNTAFIMMWITPRKPELDDVRDTVREVFKNFGITAIRADEIEHEGVITERVIQEIATSEFLFADLTGERPSVYYEIGYAHALGKRVMLFRRKDSAIHFDLAYRNCPEYDNLADLRKKLHARLQAVTSRDETA